MNEIKLILSAIKSFTFMQILALVSIHVIGFTVGHHLPFSHFDSNDIINIAFFSLVLFIPVLGGYLIGGHAEERKQAKRFYNSRHNNIIK